MPHDQDDDLEMKMFTTLGKHQREHGEAANDALLKKFGVTRAIDVKPEHFKDVIAACAAADNDEDEAPRRREDRTKANARKPLPMETVINGAADIKSGFNMAATAIHSKPPKS